MVADSNVKSEVFQWSLAGNDWRAIPQTGPFRCKWEVDRKTTGDAQKCGYVNRERDDEPLGSVVHCFQTDSRRGLMIGFGIFCAEFGQLLKCSPSSLLHMGREIGWCCSAIEVECETCWCLYSREWGNGMIVSSYCGSFSHSLLSTSKEMVSLYDLHIIT